MEIPHFLFRLPLIGSVAAGAFLFFYDKSATRSILFFVLILFSSWMQAINHDWRVGLIALVAGWVSGAVLVLSENQKKPEKIDISRDLPSGLPIKIIAVAMVLLTAVSIAESKYLNVYNLPQDVAFAGVLLGAIGLLQMSMNTNPHKVGQGIIILLIGFEIIFIWIEPALAVQFLLVLVKIVLSVVMSILGGSSAILKRESKRL